MFKPRIHTHWLFVAYDSKDEIAQTYHGAMNVDVVADDFDHALQRAKTLRPATGPKAGWDLKSVVDHLPGHCRT